MVSVYPLIVTREAPASPKRGELRAALVPGRPRRRPQSRKGLKIILSFSAGKDEVCPRASFAVMGVNRFSWGYRMLRFIRAIMPKEDRFFDMFERHAQILVAGADAMAKMFDGGEEIAISCKHIAAHENAADDVTRDVLVAVRRSFITPFDRSAITALTSAMDNAIDEMWQTPRRSRSTRSPPAEMKR